MKIHLFPSLVLLLLLEEQPCWTCVCLLYVAVAFPSGAIEQFLCVETACRCDSLPPPKLLAEKVFMETGMLVIVHRRYEL